MSEVGRNYLTIMREAACVFSSRAGIEVAMAAISLEGVKEEMSWI
jgi:hypothetical protein